MKSTSFSKSEVIEQLRGVDMYVHNIKDNTCLQISRDGEFFKVTGTTINFSPERKVEKIFDNNSNNLVKDFEEIFQNLLNS